MKADFSEEQRFYERHKEEWLASHANEFVVIAGNVVAGFFPSYAHAYGAAISRFGLDKLVLIKQVLEHEQVFVVY